MELLTCKYINSNIFRYFQALLEKLSESRVWPPPFNTTYELKFPLHLLFGSPTDISDNTGPVSYTCSVRWRVPFSERKNDGKRANWGRPAGTARRLWLMERMAAEAQKTAFSTVSSHSRRNAHISFRGANKIGDWACRLTLFLSEVKDSRIMLSLGLALTML